MSSGASETNLAFGDSIAHWCRFFVLRTLEEEPPRLSS